jgi:type I restriction enzyme S subunit
MPNLNEGIICSFPLHLPPYQYQRTVSSLLSSIDDKIELNKRMNETLESMAQAIYRDWFVDFGPVRRKLEGVTDPVRIVGGLMPDPARAAELAALFPDGFGDDGLPLGWQVARVEDLLELSYGKSMPKTARRHGDIPVYGSGGIGGYHDVALSAGPGIIVGRKGTVGSLFWESGPFFPIDTVFYVVPKLGVSLNFAWEMLGTLGLSDMNTDAAVPGLNRSNVYRLEVPRAPAFVMSAFEEIVGPLRAMLEAKGSENRTLAETRDYLLPRLMSGEVRVGDRVLEVA